jgi:hypothetical protein
MKSVEVELRATDRTIVEEIEVGVVATDEAVVDMARKQAGIKPESFEGGEVIAP